MNIKTIVKYNLYFIKMIYQSSKGRLFYNIFINIFQAFISFLLDVYVFIIVIDGMKSGKSFNEIAHMIILICLIQIIFYIIKNIFNELYIPRSDLNIFKHIQKKIFYKAKNIDLFNFENPEFYNIYVKALQEASKRATLVLESLDKFINSLFLMASISFVIFRIEPLLLIFAILPFFIHVILGNKQSKVNFSYSMETQEVNRKNDYIKRMFYLADFAKELRLSNIHKVLFKEFDDVIDDFYKIIRNYGWKIAFFEYMEYFIMDIFVYIGAITLVVYKTIVSKSMLMSGALIVVNTISSVAWYLQSVSDVYVEFREHAMYIENLKVFLDYKPKIQENQDGIPFPSNQYSMRIHDVDYHYEGKSEAILKNINMDIQQGKKIALVGPNGAGKTTLIKLILRLYEPDSGYITLNNRPISDYRLKEYRNNFGTLFQDYRLFAFSILDNIILKDHISAYERKQAIEGLHSTGVYDSINNLKDGIDSILTREFDENGVLLSGGETQKIALARIFAKPYSIAILDEPSSSLDPIAEYHMYETLLKASENKSVIYISHRLSTAVLADTVYFIRKGEIVESGTHEDLINLNGDYAKMWNKQAMYYKQKDYSYEDD